MALHRDIHWIGRQWAVTGFGMQAIDQKLGGKFDIEVERLWDDGLAEILREQKWFNVEDFDKGLAIARKRHPEPPRKVVPSPLRRPILPPMDSSLVPPLAIAPKFEELKVRKIDPVEPSRNSAEPVRLEFSQPEPIELPKAALPIFQIGIAGSARFVRPWRVLMKR